MQLHPIPRRNHHIGLIKQQRPILPGILPLLRPTKAKGQESSRAQKKEQQNYSRMS
jgi:hypothetical protein